MKNEVLVKVGCRSSENEVIVFVVCVVVFMMVGGGLFMVKFELSILF